MKQSKKLLLACAALFGVVFTGCNNSGNDKTSSSEITQIPTSEQRTENGYTYILINAAGTKTATVIEFDENIVDFNPPSQIDGYLIDDVKMDIFQRDSHKTKIKSVVLPNGVGSIDDFAFFCCFSLASVIIPDSVTSIGNSSFSNCSSLIAITLPDSVISIGDHAFALCPSLTSIYIPRSVSSVDSCAFYYESPVVIYCEAESQPYGWNSNWNPFNQFVVWGYQGIIKENGYVYALSNINNVKTATIIEFNENITDFNLPSEIKGYSVSDVKIDIFQKDIHRTKIKSVVLPNGVSTIPGSTFGSSHYRGVFSGCSSLTSITIPDSVTSIGDWAFYDCSKLTSIVIPNSVTSIGNSAFYNCSSLHNVFYSGSKSEWFNIDVGPSNFYLTNASIEYNSEVTELNYVSTDKYSYILTNDNRVYEFTIKDKTITSFDFENELPGLEVITLGNSAFYNCSSLSSITIPNSVTSIGSSAFEDCSKLTSVTIPNSVTSIGNSAFRYCSSLTSIIIPDSVTSIGDHAFCNCFSLAIYCEAESQPSGWESAWNENNRPVSWGYVKS